MTTAYVLAIAQGEGYGRPAPDQVLGVFLSKRDAVSSSARLFKDSNQWGIDFPGDGSDSDSDDGGVEDVEDNRGNAPNTGVLLKYIDGEGAYSILHIARVSITGEPPANKRPTTQGGGGSEDSKDSEDSEDSHQTKHPKLCK